jgi:hypothetical protein
MKLSIDEGTVYGLQYYNVTPYCNMTETIPWDDIEKWCTNSFGTSGTPDYPGIWTPYERWYVNTARFWFKDKKDLEWFLLRWN